MTPLTVAAIVFYVTLSGWALVGLWSAHKAVERATNASITAKCERWRDTDGIVPDNCWRYITK